MWNSASKAGGVGVGVPFLWEDPTGGSKFPTEDKLLAALKDH